MGEGWTLTIGIRILRGKGGWEGLVTVVISNKTSVEEGQCGSLPAERLCCMN